MKADLRRAASFHAIARAGGIAAASRLLGRSPPALHADLRRFEHDAGVVLMERVGRRLHLTPEGRTLFATIDRALVDIARVTERVAAGEPAELPLRLGCVTAFGRYRLAPTLFASVAADRPVQLRTDSQERLLALLAAGEIDFAIAYRPVAASPIESLVMAQEELWLVGDVARPVTLDDLARTPCIVYEEYEYVFSRWFDGVFGRQPPGLLPLDRTDELEEALLAVSAGRGFTVAPREACVAFNLSSCGPAVANEIALCAVGERLRSAEGQWLCSIFGPQFPDA